MNSHVTVFTSKKSTSYASWSPYHLGGGVQFFLHMGPRLTCYATDERCREQSRRLLMLSNRSRAYLGIFLDRCAATFQVKRTNKYVRIFASLWSFSVDLTFSRAAPRLGDYVQYLHVIGQTTLDVLGNIKILARTCPVWTAHVATLILIDWIMQSKKAL